MNKFSLYLELAHGLTPEYTFEDTKRDHEAMLEGGNPAYSPNPQSEKLIAQICEAKGISRERFMNTGAVPKPGTTAHAVYNAELRKRGFTDVELPTGQGFIVPIYKRGEVVELKFYRLSELLKKKKV